MLSKTGIVILGLLQSEALSAYDMIKKIDSMNMRYWFPIGNTTLYEAVLRLEKKGLIVGTANETKITYQVTATGTKSLQDAVRSLFVRIDYDTVWFCLAIMFSGVIQKDELHSLIAARDSLITEYLSGIDSKIAELTAQHIPYSGLCAIDRMKEILILEKASLQKLSATQR